MNTKCWLHARFSFLCIWTGMAALACCQAQEAVTPKSESVAFDDFFVDKALRLELYQCGDAREMTTTLQTLAEEPCWPENPNSLIMPFPYGKYSVKAWDAASNRLVYAKGLDSLFAEYATTKPALSGTKRVIQTTARIPMPKAAVKLTIERRNGDNSLTTIMTEHLDPSDIRIRRESPTKGDKPFEVQNKGDAHHCLDIVFLSEGYSATQEDKFKADVQKMSDYLLSVAPYKGLSDRISVRGVFRASEESGTDLPHKGVFRNTALNSSFNTLDIDRYLLLDDNHRMHQMAAAVPFDTIVVLVNSTTYGGGAICLDYCVTTTDHPSSPMVFVHELGHCLAYLADEYVGNVSYNDIYPEGVEPVEPNITRQLEPDKIKWKSFLSKDVTLPTKSSRETRAERTVGAFEGGGYLSKGMYRPQAGCWMGSANPKEGFCVVCDDAIQRMIDFYTSKPELPK
ncbi:MAG: M64 family metallo-endopeptidase [Planctomycetota bacterium]|nr:M64 family metallo-endopeptidase [Planctomycetota bacterium]